MPILKMSMPVGSFKEEDVLNAWNLICEVTRNSDSTAAEKDGDFSYRHSKKYRDIELLYKKNSMQTPLQPGSQW